MNIDVTYRLSSTRDGLYAYALRAEARPGAGSVGPVDSIDSVDSTDPAGRVDCGVFVFRRFTPMFDPGRTGGAIDGRCVDEFFNVATPVDMQDIPYGEPNIPAGMPFYRLDSLDLWFRNLEDVIRARREIARDVKSLCGYLDDFGDPSSFESVETESYGPTAGAAKTEDRRHE